MSQISNNLVISWAMTICVCHSLELTESHVELTQDNYMKTHKKKEKQNLNAHACLLIILWNMCMHVLVYNNLE